MAASYETLLRWFRSRGDQELLEWSWKGMITVGLILVFVAEVVKYHIPYGRYARTRLACNLYCNARTSWFLQELPSVLAPFFFLVNVGGARVDGEVNPNVVLLGMFLVHYIQRTFLFALCIKGGKPTPVIAFLSAVFFCAVNGTLQARYLTEYLTYEIDWFFDPRFIVGQLIFFVGMAINIHSDAVLRNLRRPGEKGYKIPRGGMFELVSGANYFGESLEWCGYALACWSWPAVAFAIFTTSMLGTRALQHHRFYLQKFEDYPKSRKAFIPFLL